MNDGSRRIFPSIKREIVRRTCLTISWPFQIFYTTTDASRIAIGGILSQGEINKDR